MLLTNTRKQNNDYGRSFVIFILESKGNEPIVNCYLPQSSSLLLSLCLPGNKILRWVVREQRAKKEQFSLRKKLVFEDVRNYIKKFYTFAVFT